ncbi:Eukaryotic translation initiation factor 4E type 2, partial [Eschrichtius robustus]|nr:Eukaryotic translation initiation factor 4E type 2 [Eschrichtius robustus]
MSPRHSSFFVFIDKAPAVPLSRLKDDDSGDHDQNEENSTQKDGEKEKTERDKSQSSGKRKAVVPGPAEHPLQYNYTFWYSRRTPGRPTSSQSYEQNIKQIGTFASAARVVHPEKLSATKTSLVQ